MNQTNAAADLDLEPVVRMSRDLRQAGATLDDQEVRYVVDSYYTAQDNRIRATNQIRAMQESGEPHSIITYLANQASTVEKQIPRAMQAFVESRREGRWLISQKGIGPVIAAGLLAHLRIELPDSETGELLPVNACGAWWRFAGLDPSVKWEKGQKRPWNASLKLVCWKAGQSFVKVSGREGAFYGQIFRQRKEFEVQQNEAGAFADQAAHILATKRIGKTTDAYKAYAQGKLPKGHLQARAERYAVKLLLSHLHHVTFECRFGRPPPAPYVMAIAGHKDYAPPPEWPGDYD